MNKVMTILFLLLIFAFYYLLGDFVLKKLGYKNENKLGVKIVTGFLLTFAIGFIIGLPSQFFSISWRLFSSLMCIAYGTITILLVYVYRDKIKDFFIQFKVNWKLVLIEHFKEFWLLYVLVVIFSVLSMANQEAFLFMNYDDHYYIGKMVNEIGTPALGNEDYYSGMLLSTQSLSLERLANSYEITYAFFSDLFHISPAFFCRVAMTFQNYLIVFLVFKNFAELIIDRRRSQYTLLMFAVLLIPHGFLMNSSNMPFGLNVRSFDAWQFQSAIFYGSSVVRCMALPTMLLFGKDMIVKFEFKKLVLLFLFSLSFLSFSTIYFQFFSLMFILFVFIKLIYLSYIYYKKNKYISFLTMILLLVLYFLVFYKAQDYDWLLLFDLETITNYQNTYTDYYLTYIISDVLMKIAPFVLLISIFIFKKIEQKCLMVILLGVFSFLRFNFFYKLIFTTSMGYHFVSLRTAAALQYFVLFLMGVIIVLLFSKGKRFFFSISTLSVCLIVTILTFVYKNFEEVKTYDYLGSGMVEDGYNFSRILTNDEMIPEVATIVGDYFDTLPYGNYSLYVQSTLPYLNTNIDFSNFNAVSNRIEICARDACGNISIEDRETLDYELLFSSSFEKTDEITKKYEIQYILVTNENMISSLRDKEKIVFNFEFGEREYHLLKLF